MPWTPGIDEYDADDAPPPTPPKLLNDDDPVRSPPRPEGAPPRPLGPSADGRREPRWLDGVPGGTFLKPSADSLALVEGSARLPSVRASGPPPSTVPSGLPQTAPISRQVRAPCPLLVGTS